MICEPNHRATYCPEDNKLRFYPDWTDGGFDKEKMKSAGYRWASKQECYVCPRWTPTAEDAALDYVEEIEDETYGPLERAADRAERFAGYRDNRREDAHDYADRMGSGTVGFQDQRRAERAARKRDRLAGHALTQWDRAEYWHARTAGVIRHAIGKEKPATRRLRIKRLEAEQRAEAKSLADRKARRAGWQTVAHWEGPDADQLLPKEGPFNEPQKLAYQLANSPGAWILPHPDDAVNEYAAELHGAHHRGLSPYDLLCHDTYAAFGPIRRLTPREVASLYLTHRADPEQRNDYGQRWARHYANRLEYEKAMLANEGGAADDAEIIPGGFLLLRGEMGRWCFESCPIGWTQIERVHKSTATGKVTSAEVWGTYGGGNTPDRRALVRVNITRFGADRYRAPTPEELAEFQAKQVEAKKAKAAGPKAPPLINPTPEDAERLQALWNARHRHDVDEYNRLNPWSEAKYNPSDLITMTQSAFSERSNGHSGACDTVYLSPSGKPQRSAQGAACKVRRHLPQMAGFSRAPYRVVILSDKPSKPLPLEWSMIEQAAAVTAE